MASQLLDHSNVRVYPGPIPIDIYARRGYGPRAIAGRGVLGNSYASRAVDDRAGIAGVQTSREVTEQAGAVQTSIEAVGPLPEKNERGSERVRYVRLIIIIEAANVLCLYGIWQLWHLLN